MNTQAVVSFTASAPSVFEVLPPWANLLISIGLLLVAALLWVINKKWMDNDSFLLEFSGIILGIGGFVGIWTALFGS